MLPWRRSGRSPLRSRCSRHELLTAGPYFGTGIHVIVTVQDVDESSGVAGPVSSMPSCCDSPLVVQQLPPGPNLVSHAGVSVSPARLGPLPRARSEERRGWEE